MGSYADREDRTDTMRQVTTIEERDDEPALNEQSPFAHLDKSPVRPKAKALKNKKA